MLFHDTSQKETTHTLNSGPKDTESVTGRWNCFAAFWNGIFHLFLSPQTLLHSLLPGPVFIKTHPHIHAAISSTVLHRALFLFLRHTQTCSLNNISRYLVSKYWSTAYLFTTTWYSVVEMHLAFNQSPVDGN